MLGLLYHPKQKIDEMAGGIEKQIKELNELVTSSGSTAEVYLKKICIIRLFVVRIVVFWVRGRRFFGLYFFDNFSPF